MYSSWIKCLLATTPLTAVLTLSSCGSSPPPSSPPVPPTPTPVASVVVTPAAVTVLRGQSQQFVAQVSGLSNQTVTWLATPNVGTIDSTGLYTAPVDAAGFPVTITATSKVSRSTVGNAVVTLPTITLSIAPNQIDVVPGVSLAFTATVVGLTDTNVNWTVQDSGGGTITSTGLYTAPSATGVYTVVVTSSADANYGAAAVVLVTAKPSSPFSSTGNLVNRRQFHTATLLADGTVLVAGGGEDESYYCLAGSDFAELYDPVLESFASTSPMIDRRYAQTSTLLQNGKVLITGGFSFDPIQCNYAGTSPPLASAELYDPSSGSFAPTGSMSEARGAHTATLLSTGKVLIVGGGNTGGDEPPFAGDGSAKAEVYDPATGTFTPTAKLSTARIGQTATLLLDGKVLIAGGVTSDSSGPLATATAELYDPLTGAFTVVGTMTAPRAGHTATLLPDGKVLITGGLTDSSLAGRDGTDTAEIYDPAKASFLATNKPMVVKRWAHTATLLPDGTVLLVGGGSVVAETYSPTDGSFSAVGLDDAERTGHTATLLKNGSVVIIGGDSQNTAELYQ
jgi:Bacterial Ig-like domain (group 2)/Galactose oxidase, central domain